MSDPIIRVRGLKKIYHVGDVDVQALRGVDLSVQRGEFLGIVGHSGSGKSTLFNILGGLTPPTSGTVHINGKDLLGMTESDRTNLRKREIGFVFQKYNLLPTLNAEDNINIARVIARREKDTDDFFQDALKLLGIAHRLHHKPRAMSGGEQQRVAIARAIVNRPSILLADEPTGNLDSATTDEILGLFAQLHREGQTIILVTHEPDVARHAKRIIRMKDGKVLSDLPIDRDAVSHQQAAAV